MADKLKEFQEKGAQRLHRILNNESRAFLADEAGLGKTFTTTRLIQLRAQEKWKNEEEAGNSPTAFVVLYVGPNQSIIRKCCKDIVKKYNDIKEGNESIQFMGVESTYDEIIRGYEKAFDAVLETRSVTLNDVETRYNAEEFIKTVKELVGNNVDASKYGKGDWGIYCRKYYREALEEYSHKIGFKNLRCSSKNEKHVQFYPTINDEYKKYIKKYVKPLSDKYDRLVFDYGYLRNEKNLKGKKILLFAVSENILDINHEITEGEKRFISTLSNLDKKEIVERTAGYFHLVAFDEYHKYFNSFVEYGKRKNEIKEKNNFKHIWDKEKLNKQLKCLFISATPYSTNKTENIEKMESKEILAEDEDKVTPLPSFELFAKMFCFNVSPDNNNLNESELKAAEDDYKNELTEYMNHSSIPKADVLRSKNHLESLLRTRMIRHERTMLSGDKKNELHIMKSECDYKKTEFCYKAILCSTNREIRKLQEIYPKNTTAQNWCKTIPGVLSFSTKAKTYTTQFEALKGYVKGVDGIDCCFSYAIDPNTGLQMQKKDLPKTTFSMAQVCQENINIDKKQHQLIWIPPTRTFYSIDEDSIFAKNHNYSKLLIFGEYSFIQRGGAALISDYVRYAVKNQCAESEMKIDSEEIIKSFFEPGYKIELQSVEGLVNKFDSGIKWLEEELELNDIIRKSEYSLRQTLFLLASPFACLIRLNKLGKVANVIIDGEEKKYIPLEKIEQIYNAANWFNYYFKKRSDVLYSWMAEQNWDNCEEWQDKLLRYCAEGNLYSVLLEWSFTQKGCLEYENQSESIRGILHDRKSGIVHVQVCKNGEFCKEDGLAVECGFAERLTHDLNDIDGSASENEVIERMNEAFNSPFYPMILFAGRGAQEGLDFHQYCRKIDHMTIPRGAASFDQRQGRIDRYRGLLVRERACEQEALLRENGKDLDKNDYWNSIFDGLADKEIKNSNLKWKRDQLFPDWQIKTENSRYHFERLVPYLKYTTEEAEYKIIKQQLDSYRSTLGASTFDLKEEDLDLRIDLSTECNEV